MSPTSSTWVKTQDNDPSVVTVTKRVFCNIMPRFLRKFHDHMLLLRSALRIGTTHAVVNQSADPCFVRCKRRHGHITKCFVQ